MAPSGHNAVKVNSERLRSVCFCQNKTPSPSLPDLSCSHALLPPLHWCACPLYSKTAYVSTVGHRGWSALHTSTSGRNKLIISSRMALDTQRGGRGAWLAESPGGLIYTSRCWARAGCKQISQDRCGNHLVRDKPSRVATTRDTPPRNFFSGWWQTYILQYVAWTMPPVNRREQCPWHTRRRSGYVLTATPIASPRQPH